MANGQFDEVIKLSVDASSGGSVEALTRAIGGLEGVSEETRRALEGMVSELADTQRLQSAAEQYNRLVDAQNDLSSALTDVTAAQARARAADQSAQASLVQHTTALDQARAAQASYLASTNRSTAADNQHAEAVQRALAAQRSAAATAGQTATALNTANTAVTRATQTQTQLGSQAARLAGQLNTAGISTNQLGNAQQILAQRAAATAQALNTQLRAAQSSVPAFDAIRGGLGKVAAAAGAALVALQAVQKGLEFGKESLVGAANIEASLSRVQAVIKASDEGIQQIQKTIFDAAQDVNVSTEQAAKAAVAFAETGRTVAQYQEALVPVLQLSKAALIDSAEAAGIVDDALDRYGLSASDAARVTDVLVTASAGSAEALKGMSAAMGKLAPAAREIGLSFDDTATYLGFFAQNGLKAEQAAEGLEKVFLGLADPASNLRQTLLQLGNAAPTFSDALTLLTNGSKQSEDALTKLDPAAKRVILTLRNQGPEALKAFADQVKNAEGATRGLIGTLNDNLNGAFDAFSNSIAQIGEKLATPVLAPLREELVKLSEQLNTFAQSEAFDRIRDSLGNLFESGVAAFDKFIQAVDWEGFVANASTNLSAASTKIQEFSSDLQTLASVLGTIANTIGGVFNAIGIVFNGLKTIVSGAILVVTEGALQFNQALDSLTGRVSDATADLTILRDAARSAAFDGLAGVETNAKSLADNLGSIAGSSTPASSGIQAVGAAAGEAAQPVFDFGSAVEKAGLASSNESFWDVSRITGYIAGLVANTAAAVETAGAQQELERKVAATRAEFEKVSSSVDSSKEAVGAAAAAYQSAQRNLEAYSVSTNRVADGSRNVSREFEVQTETVDGLTSVTARATAATRENAAAQASAERELSAARAEMLRLATTTGHTADEYQKVSDKVNLAQQKVDSFRVSSQGAAQGGEALQAALDKIGGSSATLAKNADTAKNTLEQAYAAFQTGAATLGDVQTAFDNYAAQLRKSVENSKQWEKDSVESLLAVQAGIMSINNTPLTAPDTSGFKQGVDNLKSGTDSLSDSNNRLSKTTQGASDANDRLTDSTKKTADGIKKTAEAADSSSGRIADFTVDVSKYGAAAAKAFNDATFAALENGIKTSAGLYRYISNIQRSYQMITETFEQQKSAAEGLQRASENFSEAEFSRTNGSVENYRRIADQARHAADSLTYLNEQDLSQAQAAAGRLADQIDALAEKTENALRSFKDYSDSTQDQIDQINGNQDSSEDRRFKNELDRLREQAEATNTINSQEYRDAVARANQLHALKMRQLQEQAAERKKQDQEERSSQSSSSSSSSSSGGGGGGGTGSSSGGGSLPQRPTESNLNINFQGTDLGNINVDDPRQADAIARKLLPKLIAEIQRAQRNTTRG